MRHAKTIVILILAASLAGLGYRLFLYTPTEFSQVDVAAFESDVTETLVRELLQHVGTNQASVCFLAFGHRLTPPSDAFLSRFAGHLPPLRSYAASRVSPSGDILDSSSGKVGVIIQVAKIERKSDGEFEAEAALSNLPASRNRFIYTVVQRDGRWMIKSRRPYG
ncbi:MAG: hypothetical protein HY298_23950 [Verrucomicrobia bacterium]|nr:hypothetical protein [Verrucomicrobiota bacterium]